MADLSKLMPGEPCLLQGNEAIARGAMEANVAFAAAYPGNPSSEILESLAQSGKALGMHVEWSCNEKVALESCCGASLAGLRAMASMKQNGVNVALDFICNLTLSGTGPAGLVLVTCDDPSGLSSSNEQDARFVAKLADLPLLEPCSPHEAYEMIRFAFDLSETIENLVVLRSVSRLSHTRTSVIPGKMPKYRPKPYWPENAISTTLPVIPKHKAMKEKLKKAGEIIFAKDFNKYYGPDKPELLIIAAGSARLYASEVISILSCQDKVGVLDLGCTWPLDTKIVFDCLEKTDQVLFAEEIDPFVETEVMAFYAQHVFELGVKKFWGRANKSIPLVGELNHSVLVKAICEILGISRPKVLDEYQKRLDKAFEDLLVPRDFGFCPGCPHRASYWSLKQALALNGGKTVVTGDIGCYTLGLLSTGFNQLKTSHCMGAGPGIASGMGQLVEMGLEESVISVVGDSTFFHAALPALVNAKWNNSDYLLLVLDNSATAMTGFQPHPGTGKLASGEESYAFDVEKVCEAFEIPHKVVDPYDLRTTQQALYQSLKNETGLRVLILRRACALVANRQKAHPYEVSVNESLCRSTDCGCNLFCVRAFKCPGLIFDPKKEKAMIDPVTCVGCGVCEQICPANAIELTLKKKGNEK